ncbi:unnamed protein product [Cylindrotheca closterium]|uniref:Uncharacterized protein n=1 Tax=Cylindrotheca closterium TaxID=2856 RepID=A0AAD2CUB1_9STRA|nr:unnamed protein product [Cylindrotheca closterium]
MSSSRQKKNKTSYLNGDYSNLADLAEKVDWFTQCHSPAEIFSFFSKDEGDEKDNSVIAEEEHQELQMDSLDESLTNASNSPYPLPASCEYCGAKSTHECLPACTRPKFFLVKKRPPFLAAPTLKTEWNGSQVGVGDNGDNDDVDAFETASSTISNFNEDQKNWMSEIGWRG